MGSNPIHPIRDMKRYKAFCLGKSWVFRAETDRDAWDKAVDWASDMNLDITCLEVTVLS